MNETSPAIEINPDLDLGPVARISLPIRALPTRRLQAARLISDVFNPQWLGIPLFLLVAYGTSPNLPEALLWWLVCMVTLVAPGLFYVRRGLRRRRFTDREVSVRSQRTPIYLLGLSTMIICITLMLIFQAPTGMLAALTGMLLGGVIAMLINLRWKISVHGGAIGAAASLMALVFGPGALLIGVPVVAAVGWSRVALLQHTPAQVLAGIGISSLVMVGVFRLFGVL